jgi:hypothetical protein
MRTGHAKMESGLRTIHERDKNIGSSSSRSSSASNNNSLTINHSSSS